MPILNIILYLLYLITIAASKTALEVACQNAQNATYTGRFCFLNTNVYDLYANAVQYPCKLAGMNGYIMMPTSKMMMKYIGNAIGIPEGATQAWTTLTAFNATHVFWERFQNGKEESWLKYESVATPWANPGAQYPGAGGHYFGIKGVAGPGNSFDGFINSNSHSWQHGIICQFEEPVPHIKFKLHAKGKRLQLKSLIAEEQAPTTIGCARFCQEIPVCRAFSYNKSDQSCLMFPVNTLENNPARIGELEAGNYDTWYIED